jgi:hypothetical protein
MSKIGPLEEDMPLKTSGRSGGFSHDWFRDAMSLARFSMLTAICVILGHNSRQFETQIQILRDIIERQQTTYISTRINAEKLERLSVKLDTMLEIYTAHNTASAAEDQEVRQANGKGP